MEQPGARGVLGRRILGFLGKGTCPPVRSSQAPVCIEPPLRRDHGLDFRAKNQKGARTVNAPMGVLAGLRGGLRAGLARGCGLRAPAPPNLPNARPAARTPSARSPRSISIARAPRAARTLGLQVLLCRARVGRGQGGPWCPELVSPLLAGHPKLPTSTRAQTPLVEPIGRDSQAGCGEQGRRISGRQF